MSKTNWLRILMVFVCLMLVCACVPAEDCAHPEDRQQVMYSDWESATFVNNNDGRTHTATYVNPFEMIKCMDCQLEYRRDMTMDPAVEPHGFARGVCDCGAVEEDTGCAHANSTYKHEGSLGEREFIWLNEEQHQKNYTPLGVYVCNDCGCMYDRVGEYKSVVENHRQQSGNPNECRYCLGVIGGAKTYTLTYTFENHPFGVDSYLAEMEFEAGSVVTLDVSVGEVAENHHTGDTARLKSWTEDVPSNAQPVEFSTSENQQGNTTYSFTMPARNVIVHGVWETVYSIVYVDNAWYCDDKFEEEWHMAAYGEPTPLYNGGVDPYHEGYWFAGWKPEIAETVTGNARYLARFGLDGEDCAHINFHCTSEYETRLPEDAEWTPDNAGFHTVYGWSGAVYVCDTCGKELLDGSYSDIKRMCYDGDGDGHCDTCQWYICDHPGMGVSDDHHYELKYGENWEWVRTGHHGANCNVGNWYWCELCRQGIFEPTGEEYITEGCWDNNDDDHCDGCGGQMCHHENRDVHSPDWYQPVEGENWQHVGWGHHGANCNVGIGFYCFDCEENYAETYSQEYRVEKCWEGDNKDNRCDGCGCEFGGNWGTCNHEGEQEYFNHYSVNEDGWTANDNGTHTGMALEVWGFNCRTCGEFFGRPNHDDYRLYTVPHGYNPETGKCWDCGAEMTDCEHKSWELVEEIQADRSHEYWTTNEHRRWYEKIEIRRCLECQETFAVECGRESVIEGHNYENGACACGAPNCPHADPEIDDYDVIYLLPGTGWQGTGWGQHTGTGYRGDAGWCHDCSSNVFIPKTELQKFTIDCYDGPDGEDGNGDGLCFECGWPICDHTRETLEVKDPEHYEPVEGESWEYIGNNRHTALCYKGVWYRCNKCEQEFFGDVSEEPVEAICGCWDNNDDDRCDGCHGEMVTCQHEHTSDWHTGFETGPWTDNGNETHSATGWELWGFDCYDCNEFIGERTHEDARVYTFDHGYDENGNCHCGAVWTCDHENATFNKRGKQFNQVVEDMFDGRHVRWFDVYHEYTCNDCGAVFLRYVERGEEIEEHVSHNGENCDICGAPVCDHADKELIRENVVILNPGREWRRSTTGSHTGYGVMGDIYYCGDCNHRVYARNEGEEPRYLTEDCFDGDDEDTRCDACDWPFCEHPEDQLEHKEDGFHHCVQDEGWYYVGDGKHSAVCEVGTYYYCHACDHEVFVKEVDAKLYTYDCHDGNGDESCDACGAYVAPCPHYNRTDDYYHYGGTFVDNGNGTHTGMGYEMYGFWCRDCEEYIADVTHEEAREYTFEHNFNEDGVCDADGCGAVYSGCDHENATFNKRGKQFNQIVEDMFDGRHVRWFDVYHEFTCDDCGAVFLRYVERGEEIEEHVSHNGENCDICGAPVCDHTDLTQLELVRENVVICEPGSEWHRSTTGSHTGYGVMGDIYYCGACNHRVYARNEGEEPRYLTEACFDGDDEDNRCDACDWPFCEHGNKEHLEDNFHFCVEDEGWYYVGNYQHSAVCKVGTWYFCHDCDEHVFEKQSDAKLYTYGCWDDNADGRCDACGAESCRHENIDVRNGYHYQPAPGHEWEENWYGQHGAECDVGIWFYCHDCGQEGFRRDYREYIVEQCWEGDNKDNRCDGCGHEYGENWGNCNHDGNVSTMYNHYELKDGTEWVVNDNGTHSGWAIEVWGFQCWDCGTHIAQPKHDDYRWYTVPHSLNEENNTCWDCGAAVNPCQHDRNEPTGNTEFLHVEYINNDDGTHMVVARLLDEFKCQDCGETFLRDDGHETVYAEDHTYENGKCIHCAYPQCDHSDLSKLRLEESGMVRPVWGDEWESNGTGKHTCMGVKYDRYTCTECGWAWLVPVDGTEAKYYEDDCYDDNDDDHCDECGFFFCDHEHRHVENDEHYEPVPGAKWKPSGNGRHTATCNVGYWYECDDCGQGWFVGASEETVEFEGWCWDDENRPDGHCDDCGQEMCRHEGNTSPWRNEYHCDWEYYNENLHHGWGYEVHGFECYDCDQFIGERTHKEEREFFSEHHYNEEEGKCRDCGMEMTCGHWGSANYIEGSDQWHNLVFENLFDGTHACYYDLFRGYTCVECGQTFMRNEGRHSEIQDHSIVDGECEACGAKVCTHTYTDENKIGEHILRPMPGYSFHGEGMGYHWTEYGVWYDVYRCADCGEQVFVALGEVEQNVRKDCFDVDDNDECDVCGWPVNCTHPDREPREECHWWIENAMPEHIGGGMHEVLAHFGMMYYCPDCDRDFFDAYEGYKLYAFHCEDRNGDGLCDDCRVEMECEHNGDGKEWYQHMVTGPWTDNGNGTHSAEGYWVWGFDCDCGEFIGHPDQANKITFTCDHYYEDGVCHCGVKKTCDHKNITPIDGGDFFNEVYENLYNGTHNYAYDVYEWTHCNDCDTDFLRFIVREGKYGVAHEFEDGVCGCGAQECDHAETTPVELNEFLGSDWKRDYRGHHEAWGAFYDRYNCDLCRETVLVQKSDEGIHTFDCFDDDEDGECDECGYDFCQHPNLEPMNDEHYEPIPGSEWEYNGNGTHRADCRVAVLMWCPDCGHHTRDYISDEIVTITQHCWDKEDGGDGYCDDCGAEYVPCTHPNKVLDNPEHWEPVEGEKWVYDSNGYHKALCNIGPAYECPDCDEYVIGEPERFRVMCYQECWDDDGDGECDGCGKEYLCDHKNADRYEGVNEYVCDEWIDNGDGTHSGMGYEKNGYHCPDCGQFIAGNTHDNPVKFTMPHEFGADGLCVQCGAEQPTCEHENVTPTGAEPERVNPWIGDRYDGQHIIWYDELITCTCDICGETVKVLGEERKWVLEDHTFEDGECVCGAKDCVHEKKLQKEDEFITSAGSWKQPDGYGKHGVYGAWYDIYVCEECGQFEYVLTRAEEYVVEDCFDEDDGHCDECGWKFCEHPEDKLTQIGDVYYDIAEDADYVANQTGCHIVHATKGKLYECPDCGENVFVPDGEGQGYFFECLDEDNDLVCDLCGWEFPDCDHANRGEEYSHFVGDFEDNGDGTHYGYGTELKGFWCPDCKEYLAKPTHEDLKYFENIPHSWDDDGKCSECGALKADCVHPQDKQTLLYWQGGEVASYSDHGDSYHTVVYVTATEHYECGVCGEKYQVLAEMKEDIQTHSYVDDKCACGAANDRCAHENREWRYEDRKDGKYVYLNEEFHSASYTALDMYQCLDCSCFFSIEGEHKTIAEEAHVLIGENECAYCGEFGDMYKLTFKYEGDLPSYVGGRDTRVKAGDTVTLPIPVGQVVENQETGFRTRLESWTETVPEGKNPVEFSYATDEWGNTEYSFTMPEREVTMTGTWEQVYSVVYCDGVEDEELFRDEWHAVNYGEPTPAFNGGEDPVREGYVFTGWDPAVAETVTEDVEYYAQWAECAHENFEYTENWAASGYRGWAEQIAGNDYKHTALYAKHHEAKCLACGALFSHVYEEGAEETDHAYDNGKCTQCAYACSHADKTNGACDACGTEIFCEHLNKTEVETGVYKLAADSQWTPDGMGYHVGMAQLGTLYHCGECNRNLFVPLEDAKEYRFKCEQDTNDDGLCDVCFGKMPDTAAPRFQFVGLEPPTGVVGCEVKVTARFTDETELSRYEVLINDVVKATGELSGTEGEFELTFTDLEVGEHIFKIQVYDAAGNRSKYEFPTVTITAANTAPVIEDIDSTAGNTFKAGTEVTFSTKVTDDYGLSKVEMFIDGNSVKNIVVGDPLCPVSFTTDALTVGEHTVRVVAEDKDGLTAEKSLTVTVFCEHEFGDDHICDICGYGKLTITRQPENTWAYVGENAMFTVEAVGDELTYTWYYKNASASSFSESSVKAASIGVQMTEARDGRQMYCVVKDKYGNTVKTDTVAMTLRTKLEITKQPVNAWAYDGESAKVSVTAAGDGLTYQWYYKNVGDEEFTASTTKTASYSLKMNADRDGHQVYCEVIDAHGNILKSDTVTLDTRFKPVITKQPESVTASDLEKISFSIEATGDGLTYQWYYRNAGTTTWKEAASKDVEYNTEMQATRDGRQVYCEVKDAYGNSISSNTVTMRLPVVKISTQPVSTWAYDGENVAVGVEATGDGLTYTWYYKNASSSSFKQSSLTTPIYAVKATESTDGRQVYCVVTDAYGNTAKSDTVTLDTRFVLSITQHPQSVTASAGKTITFTVTAMGDGLEYRWYYRNAGMEEWTEAASTKASYSTEMQAARNGCEIYCVVKDAYGNSESSAVAKMSLPVVEITKQPTNAAAYEGEKVTISVTATGDGLEYAWYYKNVGESEFTEATIETETYSLIVNEECDGRQVYCRVTDKYGRYEDSETVTLTTKYKPIITKQPENVMASAGEVVTFSVEATGEGPFEYQWYYRNQGTTTWKAASSTQASYAIDMQAAKNGRQVYCKVTDVNGKATSSDTATMSLPMPEIKKNPESVTVAMGDEVTFIVEAIGDGPMKYQWYYRNAGTTTWKTSSITEAEYTTEMQAANNGREVYCKVTDVYGQTVKSATATMNLPAPKITKHPENVTAAAEEDVTFTVEATGNSTLKYQWYYRNAGTSTWKTGGSTTAVYTTTMKEERDGREVYCKVTDVYGSTASSDIATMILTATQTPDAPDIPDEPDDPDQPLTPLEITSQPSSVTASAEEDITFTIEVKGDDLKYQWYYRNAGTTTWKEGGGTTAIYTTTMKEERDGREVYCKVTDVYGNTVSSNIVAMNLPVLEITKQPESMTASAEEDITFAIEAKGDGLKYQWYYRNAGTSTWKEGGSTSDTYTTTMKEERDGREIYCKVTDAYGKTAKSDTVKMILKESDAPDIPDEPEEPKTPLEITSQPSNVTAADGDSATVSVTVTGDGLKYQWYYRNAGTTTWKAASSTSSSYTFDVTTARDGRQIYCKITDAYGKTVESNTVKISVKVSQEPDEPEEPKTPLEIISQPNDVTAADGDSATVGVKATGDGLKYQWYYRNAGASTWKTASSTSSSYTFDVTTARDGRQIYCKISDSYGQTLKSRTLTVTVK